MVMGLLALAASWAGHAHAVEPKEIRQAIDRGVQFLKSVHEPRIDYSGGSHQLGTAALGGLALLAADVPPNDPTIVQIHSFVREKAFTDDSTYHISLALMFLDRLGDPADVPLIQWLGVRLLAGQTGGGWRYTVPNLPDQQNRELKKMLGLDKAHLRNTDILPKKADEPKSPAIPVPRDDLPKDIALPSPPTKPQEKPASPAAKTPSATGKLTPRLHPAVGRAAGLLQANPLFGNLQANFDLGLGGGDNSNTQFGILGVWIARRHGVPCDRALAWIDLRFRKSQDPETGGWGYTGPPPSGASPSMTCAGLLGLAIGAGGRAQLRTAPNLNNVGKVPATIDLARDPQLKAGLTCLGQYLARETKGIFDDDAPPERRRKRKNFFGGQGLADDLYFLWSLERVAVVYGLTTIGKVDWYAWGAEALVHSQGRDGSWGHYGGDVGTCFALLFLCQANLANDLTTLLQGRVKDPFKVELKSGTNLADLIQSREPTTTNPSTPVVASPNSATPAKPFVPGVASPNPLIDRPTVTPAAPMDELEMSAEQLARQLLQVDPGMQREQLAKLRDTKGVVYTLALLRAIPRLDGEMQKAAREALAERLTRMTAHSLRLMLHDADAELRRAAALACGMKDDRTHIPDLIETLGDREMWVVRAARASLKSLTGQDFGPRSNATAEQIRQAQIAWRQWWMQQAK